MAEVLAPHSNETILYERTVKTRQKQIVFYQQLPKSLITSHELAKAMLKPQFLALVRWVIFSSRVQVKKHGEF